MNYKIPVLMYHEVSTDLERLKKVRCMQPTYCISVSKFEKQLTYLKRKKYESILINKIDEVRDIFGKLVAITFDDGFIGNYKYALPLLIKYGYKATFFVTVNLVGESNYMSWNQLKTLKNAGMSIQSHSLDHEPLAILYDTKILEQLKQSKEMIENNLNTLVTCISFPHGSYNERVIKIARCLGYRKFVSSDIGYYDKQKIIPRCIISDKIKDRIFLKVIDGKENVILLSRIMQICRNTIKRIIGVNLYRKIYRKIYRIELKR